MSEINDGYGEASVLDPDYVLADYHRWLYRVAKSISFDTHRHDDLVQEGRIAMWRAMATHDPTRGALASWLTTAAETRMRDVAYGKVQPTGHEAMRGSRPAEVITSIDAVEPDVAERLFGLVDALGEIEIAYHHGEIQAALSTLSPSQREYVFLRFWGGLDPSSRVPEMKALVDDFPVLRKRFLWSGSSKQVGAKQRLADALVHLVAA